VQSAGRKPIFRGHTTALAGLLALSAALAFTSLRGDSITFDETSHLTAGMSCLRTGDFRLAPEHPPLARIWAALPLLVVPNRWPGPQTPGWQMGEYWAVGQRWLFELNDGQRLLVYSRAMMLVVMLATAGAVYALARTLFGSAAALTALAAAALDPTLLAHGRLVTTDVPATLLAALVLLAFHALTQRVSPGRIVAAGVALAGLALVKMSWALILAALTVMFLAASVGGASLELVLPRWNRRRNSTAAPRPGERRIELHTPLSRLTVLAGAGLATLLILWAGIWSCYGFRYSPFRGADRDAALMLPTTVRGEPLPQTMAAAWDAVLRDAETGQQLRGLTPELIRFARDRLLLPEAYLYGLAFTLKTTRSRTAYLCGQVSERGWYAYYPLAIAIKTPLPTLLLALAGLAALFSGRVRAARPVLWAGLLVFTLVYLLVAIVSRFNIGHRHVLPFYLLIWVLAGAAAGWVDSRGGRWLVGGLLGWLALSNVLTWPHYLSYFNEAVGGPRRGHLYLADSNIDWGQDLKRLADYVHRQELNRVYLSYFGSADPRAYVPGVELLAGFFPPRSTSEPGPGVYVVSITNLLGVYLPEAREEFWKAPEVQARYAQLQHAARTSAELEERRRLQFGRLACALRRRAPDDRVGWSLWVYRVSTAELQAALKLE